MAPFLLTALALLGAPDPSPTPAPGGGAPPVVEDAVEPAVPGRFERYAPLSLADLYEKRMRFSRRDPLISVGIMDGQSQVTVSATGPLRLMLDEDELPKTIYAATGSRFTLKRLSGTPAVVRYWVVVESRGAAERGKLDALAGAWRARGHGPRIFEVGTLLGVRGNVLDTRQWQLAIGGSTSRADGEALLRTLVRDGKTDVFVHEELVTPPSGVIGVLDDRGTVLHRAPDSVYVGTVSGARVRVFDVEHSRGYKNHGRENREFHGHLYVVIDGTGQLAVVSSVGAERVLAGLVPAEIFATAPLEALKAQAVTARGEIFSKLAHRHFADPFHLCSEQHCQVYSGAQAEQPSTDKAVEQTRGLLAFRPRTAADEAPHLVDSVYSSSCGGWSEANEAVWGTPPSGSLRPRLDGNPKDPALAPFTGAWTEPGLRAFLAAYPPTDCARSTFAKKDRFRWKRSFGQAELDVIGETLGVGRIRDVRILGRGPGGRITGLELTGVRGKTEVLRELPVRRLFGQLSSGFFVLDVSKSADGDVTTLAFTGGGWGHGVGMCQTGAIGRAERGHDFRQILDHYYSGVSIEQVY